MSVGFMQIESVNKKTKELPCKKAFSCVKKSFFIRLFFETVSDI